MTTATDIISGALRLISSATPGEAIEGTEASNALTVLNAMIAGWSAESFLIPFRTVEHFPLVVGQTSYTIGAGANFNTVRPDEITNFWIYDTVSGLRYTDNIMLTKEQYDAIPLNTIQAIPNSLYYDTQFPNGVVYIFPTSSLTSYQLWIESRKPVLQFSSLTASMVLPGEYFKAMKYLLADDLAPEYGFPIGAQLQKNIDDSRKMIKRKNTKRVVAKFDAALGNRRIGNIISGWP